VEDHLTKSSARRDPEREHQMFLFTVNLSNEENSRLSSSFVVVLGDSCSGKESSTRFNFTSFSNSSQQAYKLFKKGNCIKDEKLLYVALWIEELQCTVGAKEFSFNNRRMSRSRICKNSKSIFLIWCGESSTRTSHTRVSIQHFSLGWISSVCLTVGTKQ
jgi:hypothetical protein